MNYAGQKFGRLTVKGKYKGSYYTCECECGTVKSASIYHLIKGNIRSCGCLHREELAERNSKHGLSSSVEYVAWSKIKRKTTNPDDVDWYLYGARGITMSDEFFNSFECFYEYLGKRPESEGTRYSVGRIDNNKGYERGNIRWETDSQQAKNKRKKCTNKSGKTGVYFATTVIKGREYTAWVASWTVGLGVKKTKNFSTNKYGHENAFKLATECREKMIEELNKQGAGYSESHGK